MVCRPVASSLYRDGVFVDSKDWIGHLKDDSKNYFVDDFALALIGDDEGHVTDATPTLLFKVRHVETDLSFTFTFRLPVDVVSQLAVALDAMSFDLDRDCVLGDLDGRHLDD